jgi:hypothetical protein
MHATREVQDSLLSAVNEGEKKCRKFVNSALSVGQSVSFYSPISKSQLKTFEHMNAKGVSHGFVQMVYYCLDLFLISLQSCLLHFSCEVLLVHAIPALSFIALLSDAMKGSRWMPVYILDMLDLSAEIKSAIEKGEFFIRQTSGSFNGNWSDVDTEKTS